MLKRHLLAKLQNYISNYDPKGVAVVFIVIFAVVIIIVYISRRHLKIQCGLWCLLVALWGTILLEITVYGRDASVNNSLDSLFISFRELSIGNTGILYDMLFNIVLFIPFGALVMMQFTKRKAIIFVFAISLSVEFAQLLTDRGLFEVSDLLMNCIGGLIGILTYTLLLSLVFRLKSLTGS